MVVWLGIHDACDLAFRIGNRSHHGIVGHHEQTAIPGYFLNCHAVAVGPGPASLEWVLSLCAGGSWLYDGGGYLLIAQSTSKEYYIDMLSKLFCMLQCCWVLHKHLH